MKIPIFNTYEYKPNTLISVFVKIKVYKIQNKWHFINFVPILYFIKLLVKLPRIAMGWRGGPEILI